MAALVEVTSVPPPDDVPLGPPSAVTSAFCSTQISPVESELMKMRPFLSKATPTGRKHEPGQTLRSLLERMSLAPVVLSGGSVGWPLEKATTDSV